MPERTPAQRPADPILAEFLDSMDWVPTNKANATGVLNAWHRWLTARDTDLLAATRRDVRAYLAERRDAGRKPATVRTHWRQLRAFYRWAATPVRQGGGGELAEDPMDGLAGPSVPVRPATKAAPVEDVRTLEEHFDTSLLGRRNAAMVSLMFRSGCRVGELPHVDLAHYNVRPSDGRAILHIPLTKNGEPRDVPVHPETQRYLERYLRRRGRHPGPLFAGDALRTADINGRLTARAIQVVVRRAATACDIKLSPHQLRRTFTSQYLRSSGDVLSLEIIGGWKDPRMPRRYLADEEAAAAIDRYFDVVEQTPRPAPRRRQHQAPTSRVVALGST